MLANRSAALARTHASEQGVNKRLSEPGGISVNGVSLTAYNEYLGAHERPLIAAGALEAAITPDEESAFYIWKVLDPVRFDDLPSGVDYAVADWAVNSGVAGALNACRRLYRTTLVLPEWRMDVALLKALCASPAALAVDAICNMRWAMMQANPDFTTPSAVVKGKILGDGRAFRMSAVHRGAMELIGFPPETDKYQVAPFQPPT
jgi:lysozyme family protein